jgi:hypothetical protein
MMAVPCGQWNKNADYFTGSLVYFKYNMWIAQEHIDDGGVPGIDQRWILCDSKQPDNTIYSNLEHYAPIEFIPCEIRQIAKFLRLCIAPTDESKHLYTVHLENRKVAIDWMRQKNISADYLFYTGISVKLNKDDYDKIVYA